MSSKQLAYLRAIEHLASMDDERLPYASLELRMVLEAIVYKKLQSYFKRLPASMLATWQPPQAMRALKEYEPLADEDFAIRVSPESSPGIATGEWQWLGHHKTIRLRRLRKLYNALGSHLHVKHPFAPESGVPTRPDSLRRQLNAFVKELEPIVQNDFEATFAEVFEFECEKCRTIVVRNAESAERTKRATCLNASCAAEYHIETDGMSFTAQLMVTVFDCAKCSGPIPIENRFLAIGYSFTCPACSTRHQLVERLWKYGAILEEPSPEPPQANA